MENSYKKGKWYRGLGYYLEIRKTFTSNKRVLLEHIFTTPEKDSSGACILNRVLISDNGVG
jgi:hypothetical protein